MNVRFLYCFTGILTISLSDAGSSGNISCDFETGTCGWSSSPQGDFIWRLGSGPTPDRTSGPNVDHTYGNKTGMYLYIRSRDARLSTWTAIITQNVTLKQAAILEFWYFMNGNGVGSLSITQSLNDGSRVMLWTRNGRQSQQWTQAFVDLPSGKYTLDFEARAAYHYGGDLAIDDITMLENVGPTTETSNHVSTTQQTTVLLPFSCDFERGLCGIKSPISFISSLRWIIRSEGISFKGQYLIKGDNNTGKGNYLLIESPVSGQNGDSADLELPWMETTQTSCLTLSYIMPSKRSGTISVYKKYASMKKKLLFEISGYRKEKWNLMYLTIKQSKHFQIVIQGSHTGVPYSVLGIDDIHVNTGPCQEYTTKPPESTIPTLPQITISRHSCTRGASDHLPELTCDFSDSLCEFNATRGFLTPSWYRTNSSKYFLSSKDITDNFIYANMDSWYVVPNRTSTLSSQYVEGANLCLNFEYYLNDVSSNLVLLIENPLGIRQIIWRANYTDRKWKVESININYGEKIKILFNSRKMNSKSLVGLDNIKGYVSQDVTTTAVWASPSSSFEISTDLSTEVREGTGQTRTTISKPTLFSKLKSTKSEVASSYTKLPLKAVTTLKERNTLTSESEWHGPTVFSANTDLQQSSMSLTSELERHKPTMHVSSQTTSFTDLERHKSEQTDSSYTTGVVVGVLVPTISLSAILVLLITYNKKWKSRKVTENSKASKTNVSDTFKGHSEQNGHVYSIEMNNCHIESYTKLVQD